jgi:hypothetical protein
MLPDLQIEQSECEWVNIGTPATDEIQDVPLYRKIVIVYF